MIDLWTLLTSDVTLCWTWEVKRASQSAAAFVLVIRGEQQPLVYASSYILPTHTHTHLCTPYRTYLSSWHILERDNCFSSLTSCCGTPGLPICTRLHLDVVKTPAHRHLHGQHATDGEIKCTVNAWMLVTYGKLLRCGDNMRGGGRGLWRPYGPLFGFQCLDSNWRAARWSQTAAFDGAKTSHSFLHFRVISVFLSLPERIYSHTVTGASILSVVTLATLTTELPSHFMAFPGGRFRAVGGARHPWGLSNPNSRELTPLPLVQFTTDPQVRDKPWQVEFSHTITWWQQLHWRSLLALRLLFPLALRGALINVKKSLKEMPTKVEEFAHHCSSSVDGDKGIAAATWGARRGTRGARL